VSDEVSQLSGNREKHESPGLLQVMADLEAQNFVQYVHRSLDEEENFHFLRFEFLQRLNLSHFYAKLARMKSQIQKQGHCSADEFERLQHLLRDYGNPKSSTAIK
jgi:hypothetical protein